MRSTIRSLTLFSAQSLLIAGLSSAAAVQKSGSIESFFSSSDFNLVTTDVMFRFSELAAPAGGNASTHILIDGLVPVESGSAILTSSYRGINIADGAEFDVGQVYLQLPAPPSGDGASSPIVGIVARAGGWDAFTTTPVTAPLAGSSGTVSFDDADDSGLMSFSFGSFTGTAGYSLVSESVIDVAAFSLTDGTSTYSFEPLQLAKWGAEWYGVMMSADASPAYDALMYSLRLSEGGVSPREFLQLFDVGTPDDGIFWSWNFKYLFEILAFPDSGLFYSSEFNSFIYVVPSDSLNGFWMYLFNWFDGDGDVAGGSWVFTGYNLGMRDMQPSGAPLKVQTFIYSAVTDRFYFFQEYDNAPANAGNYWLFHPANGYTDSLSGADFWKVQEPLDDNSGNPL
jgi:hypothetical protein